MFFTDIVFDITYFFHLLCTRCFIFSLRSEILPISTKTHFRPHKINVKNTNIKWIEEKSLDITLEWIYFATTTVIFFYSYKLIFKIFLNLRYKKFVSHTNLP